MVRSVTTRPSPWGDEDRALVLALLAERADTCPSCGHPVDVCRDPATAGHWQVLQEICQPGRVAQAVAEDVAKDGRRGVVISTRRTGGTGG